MRSSKDMAILRIRTLGVSWLIENIVSARIDGELLAADFQERFGAGSAVMRAADAGGDRPGAGPIEALLVDRKSATNDSIRAALEAFVRRFGAGAITWTEEENGDGFRSTMAF